MTIRSRLKKLEALPMERHAFMDSMANITTEQAEKTYNGLMGGSHPPLFAMTNNGKVPINELPEQKLGRIYKEYADGNFEIITEREI
ncbi:MAG: hypothetical protein AB1Z38_06585 [Desulfotignum sp.]